MGNDGGSIPTRRELVKTSATAPTTTALREKQREHLAHRWSQCPISHRALVPPIVSDFAGDLYNKDAVLQFLLGADAGSLGVDIQEAEAFIQGRIKGLRDVVEVKFEVERDEVLKTEKWLCPVTGKELGVGVRSVYVVPCGHAFSYEAVREMKGGIGAKKNGGDKEGAEEKGECSVCGEAYNAERDVVPILPSTEGEKELVTKRMEGLRAEGLTHGLKKEKGGGGKKRKVEKEKEGAEEGAGKKAKKVNGNGDGEVVTNGHANASSNGIKNSATANLTKKVLEEEEARKKRKLENENISSLYAKKTNGQKERDGSFMTRGFSVK